MDDALAKALAENERRSRAMTDGLQSGHYGTKPAPVTDEGPDAERPPPEG